MSTKTANNNGIYKRQPIQGESLTQQHMKAETEMSNKVGMFMKTGRFGDNQSNRQPMYADFSSIDFMEMRNAIVDIDAEFASLPSKLRTRFQNDPHQLIRFVENPNNREEAMQLGLLPKPARNEPQQPAEQAQAGQSSPPASTIPS